MKTRPLTADDLDIVTAIDKEIFGRSRRAYYKKRIAAALRNPHGHIQVGVEEGDGLVGFILARVLEGEFGQEDSAALLEMIGVAPAQQSHGIGRALMDGLEEVMRQKGIATLRTEAAWTDHAMLRFLDAAGFALAPRQVIERPVDSTAELL
jgi:ribosomal protein S18 acetylase RimI-like enzyme